MNIEPVATRKSKWHDSVKPYIVLVGGFVLAGTSYFALDAGRAYIIDRFITPPKRILKDINGDGIDDLLIVDRKGEVDVCIGIMKNGAVKYPTSQELTNLLSQLYHKERMGRLGSELRRIKE